MSRWTCCFCYTADHFRNVFPIEFLEEGFNESSFFTSVYYAHAACIEEHFHEQAGFSRQKDAFVDLTNNAQFLIPQPPNWHCCFCGQEDVHQNVRITKVIKTGRAPREQIFAAHPVCMTHHFDKRMGILHELRGEEDAWRESVQQEIFQYLDKHLFVLESIPLMNMLLREATRAELQTVLREQNVERDLGASEYQIRNTLNQLLEIAQRHPRPETAKW